jgi:methyltransferase (TIGR00027 family)
MTQREGARPSHTAQWVAAARSLGVLLPEELLLARDPHGVDFTHGTTRAIAEALLSRPRLARALLRRAGPLTSFLLWMQLRTRALDDVLLDFVRSGGRQIVLLGAGYDSRALRFSRELEQAVVFEVDAPATQARKVAGLPAETLQNRVVYAPWDFERDAPDGLPARLAELGLDRREPVLTIWEGVTMYLGESAIHATVRAIRAFCGRGSRLAVTYMDRKAISSPRGEHGLHQLLTARVGEPYRFGWHPNELAAWFRAREFELLSDATDSELAARFYPARVARRFKQQVRHIAVFEVRSGA